MTKRTKERIERWIINPFKMALFNTICKLWIILFVKKDERELKYKIALCLIFNNESRFLKEWLDYHLAIGVDHFYLYNNNSTDDYMSVLHEYIKKDIVTLIQWPHNQAQMAAYKNCYEKFRTECNWISFIDADEFICLKEKWNIIDWLKGFSKYPAINIQWLVFGTGGHLKHDFSKNVLEQYFCSWDHFFIHGKCIINTRYDIANYDTPFLHHHTYMYYKILGFKFILPAVNQFGFICTYGVNLGGGFRKTDKLKNASIQINHYYSKSWDIYYEKMHKADVYFDKNPKGAMRFFRNESRCITTNYTITRFLIKMKLHQGLINW